MALIRIKWRRNHVAPISVRLALMYLASQHRMPRRICDDTAAKHGTECGRF
jgi:hypothetical protein